MEKGHISRKAADVFNRGFFVFYIILFILTAVAGTVTAAVFGELGKEYPMPVFVVILRFTALILSFALIAAGFVALSRFLLSDRGKKFEERGLNTRLIFICAGIRLAVQLVFAFCLQIEPITDIANLDRYAKQIVTDNSFACLESDMNNHYIIRYQNNIPVLLIYTLFYKITYSLTGTFSHIPLIVLNTLALNSAAVMTVLTARRIFGERKALLTLVICALFAPYYTYAPYFYTDSLSIPFTAGTVYAFVVAVQSEKRGKKLFFLLLSGALCFIGFKLKASVIILIIALLLYLPVKYGVKRALKIGGAWLLSFCVLFVSVTATTKLYPLISDEASDRYEFPPAHWIMMGLKDLGAFNFEDSDFSQSFETKAERQEAEVNEIVKRASGKGFFGMVVHIGTKASWTYMDGTYYIANYLGHYRHKTALHSLVLYDGEFRFPFYVYSFGYQLFLMAMIAYSGLHARRKHSLDFTTLFRAAIFGMVLFFLIWETNARYPFNFTPLYMLLATEGVCGFAKRMEKSRIFGRLCKKSLPEE